jgi:hypothetical protein
MISNKKTQNQHGNQQQQQQHAAAARTQLQQQQQQQQQQQEARKSSQRCHFSKTQTVPPKNYFFELNSCVIPKMMRGPRGVLFRIHMLHVTRLMLHFFLLESAMHYTASFLSAFSC